MALATGWHPVVSDKKYPESQWFILPLISLILQKT